MDKGFKFMRIAGDDTTKKANVYPAFALGCCDFFFQVRNSRGGWDGIQRHIHDGGDPAKSSGLGARVKALPFCTARFIEVNMSVDQPREEDVRGMVGIWGPLGEVGSGENGIIDGGNLSSRTRNYNRSRGQLAGDDSTRGSQYGD